MKYSYSRVECFNNCPYQFKLRYLDKLKTYNEYDPTSALILGTCLHKGIETDCLTAINEYYKSYPIISDKHIDEQLKLEYLIPIAKEILTNKYPNGDFEVKLECDNFIGYIDYLYPLGDGTFGIIDFKYSNNIDRYMQSKQLHVYKYYAEKLLNITVGKLTFMFIPKVQPRLKQTENLVQFRKRLIELLDLQQIVTKDVKYDENKVKLYFEEIKEITNSKDYPKNITRLCDWCEFKEYCIDGNDLNLINNKEGNIMLPNTSRVAVAQSNYVKLWIFGAPFSGKTTLVDKSDTPLNLNTDGNVKYVTMPRLPIKDEVTTIGRITKRKYAWEVFTEAIDELEKGSEFKTVVVDLLEDVYDYARVFMCQKNNWEHESDDSFKAYDIVRSEFLRNVKRLLNLPYNIVLISHEDTSRDIMTKDKKITAITPNIAEKLRNKIAGMVDLVCRVVVESDGTRKLTFKSNEVVFGGGRLQGVKSNECELTWEALMNVYKEAFTLKVNKPLTAHMQKVEDFKKAQEEPKVQETEVYELQMNAPDDEEDAATPVRRTRRVRGE